LVTAICYENRSERLPHGSNRDKKRKRKLPESRYPRFRASDATHIESGNLCAASARAFEVYIRWDTIGYIEDERDGNDNLIKSKLAAGSVIPSPPPISDLIGTSAAPPPAAEW